MTADLSADHGIGSWPARRARIDPARIALRQGDRVRTYAELAGRVDRLALALRGRGVGPGDRVAWLGQNDVAGFETLFATTRLGAIFVPMNTRLAAPEVAYLVQDCAPTLLVYGPECAPLVAGSTVPLVNTVDDLEALVAAGDGPLTTAVGLDDAAVILYTSGTTGRPKGAVLTHGNLTWNTVNNLAHLDVVSTDVALCISPLFHATGLGQVSLPTLLKGGTLVVVAKFDAGAVLAAIEAERITAMSAVPTMLQLLAEHPDFDATDLSSLRYVNYGGSAASDRVSRRWQDRGVVLQQGYGMTEASPGVYMARPDGASQRPTSIGTPHFFTDVRFADGPAVSGARGELQVSGPHVFAGYWQRPEATAEVLVGGWYATGDVVEIAADGWAYVVDRVKDMIISGGENIYPSEVEQALVELDGISDAAVVAVADERWGEVGLAVVVADASGWDEAAVRAALAGRIAAYKIPKYVRFVEALPRNATGKVVRGQLPGTQPPIG